MVASCMLVFIYLQFTRKYTTYRSSHFPCLRLLFPVERVRYQNHPKPSVLMGRPNMCDVVY